MHQVLKNCGKSTLRMHQIEEGTAAFAARLQKNTRLDWELLATLRTRDETYSITDKTS